MKTQLLALAKERNWPELHERLTDPPKLAKTVLSELITRSVVSGDVRLIKKLIGMGANVNSSWNTYTPLTTSCELVDL